MRIRRQKNFVERWAAVARYLVEEPAALKSRWRGEFQGLRLELGCGKGLYLSRQAALSSETLFVGVEKQTSAALHAMELAAREGLRNALFIAGDAERLTEWFDENELDRIDILFCDPWPQTRRAKRRLTHRRHLAAYAGLLRPGGTLCVRTDNAGLFDFTLGELAASGWEIVSLTRDLHGEGGEPWESMTGFEEKFTAAGVRICQVKCRAGEPG